MSPPISGGHNNSLRLSKHSTSKVHCSQTGPRALAMGAHWHGQWGSCQTCSQDRQCQDQDQDQDHQWQDQDQDQDRKWQYETKCTQFTQILLLSNTSKTLTDVKFTTEYSI